MERRHNSKGSGVVEEQVILEEIEVDEEGNVISSKKWVEGDESHIVTDEDFADVHVIQESVDEMEMDAAGNILAARAYEDGKLKLEMSNNDLHKVINADVVEEAPKKNPATVVAAGPRLTTKTKIIKSGGKTTKIIEQVDENGKVVSHTEEVTGEAPPPKTTVSKTSVSGSKPSLFDDIDNMFSSSSSTSGKKVVKKYRNGKLVEVVENKF